MKVKTQDVSMSDIASAQVFFTALAGIWNLSNADVLDAFARNGQLTVSSYLRYINPSKLECWELNEEHAQSLKSVGRKTVIGDSYKSVKAAQVSGVTFDMIVIDTPQGVHTGDGHKRVEHFDFLPKACNLIGDAGLIVLYCNKHPYDAAQVGEHGYDLYPEYDYTYWMNRRKSYYGVGSGGPLTEAQMLSAYECHLVVEGLKLNRVLTVPCFSDVEGLDPYAFRVALSVSR